jgi:hypothetical protein
LNSEPPKYEAEVLITQPRLVTGIADDKKIKKYQGWEVSFNVMFTEFLKNKSAS